MLGGELYLQLNDLLLLLLKLLADGVLSLLGRFTLLLLAILSLVLSRVEPVGRLRSNWADSLGELRRATESGGVDGGRAHRAEGPLGLSEEGSLEHFGRRGGERW